MADDFYPGGYIQGSSGGDDYYPGVGHREPGPYEPVPDPNLIGLFSDISVYKGDRLSYRVDSFPGSEEGKAIPVVYGTKKVQGNIIYFGGMYDILFENYGDEARVYSALWEVLCFGKVKLKKVITNMGTMDEDYIAIQQLNNTFNDGTEDYYPENLRDFDGNLLQYLSKLSGISHIFFDKDKAQGFGIYTSVEEAARINTDQIAFTANTYNSLRTEYIVERELTVPLPANNFDGLNNPAGIIYDILTNTQWGCSVSSDNIALDEFTKVAQFMYAKGYGVSAILSSSVQARDFIQRVCEWCGIRLFKDLEGVYRLRAYDPNDSVISSMSSLNKDFIDFTITKSIVETLPNDFRGIYASDDSNGEAINLSVQNETNIGLVGGRILKEGIDLSGLGSVDIASKRLTEIMRKESYPTINISCTTNLKFSTLKPMDLIQVTNEEHSIYDEYFRVSAIDYSRIDENKLSFQLEQATEVYINTEYGQLASQLGTEPIYKDPGNSQNLTFDRFSNTSNARTTPFNNINNAVIIWGTGQEQKGLLVLNTDYIIIESTPGSSGYDTIQLTSKWDSTVQSNYFGLLNIDTWEKI